MTEVNVSGSVIIGLGRGNVCLSASISGNWSAHPSTHPILNLAEEHSVRLLVMGRVTLNPCFLAITADRERLSTY